jgi:uroporphyrinogen-III decarboxylase
MQPVDRLPFWPKLGGAYSRAQAGPFRDMSIDEIHDWIGSDKHVWLPACVQEERERCHRRMERKGKLRHTEYVTPLGTSVLIEQFDVASQAWHPITHPVETVEDIRRMTAFYENAKVVLDREVLAQVQESVDRYGEDAVTATSIGKSPLMHWVEFLAGIEGAHMLLADYQDEVEELFAAMHRALKDRARLIAEHSPVDLLYMTENTSTTLISPAQYKRYCYPHVQEYGKLARERGRLMALHMCGHLKLLLPDLAQLPVDAFEAFTTPTLGNTTWADGRAACPNKCLIGGTNAMLWIETPDRIVSQLEHDLAQLEHHRGIAVTSAGVMPPLCPPETIKAVCEWTKGYQPRL